LVAANSKEHGWIDRLAGQNVSNPSVPGTGVLAYSNESVTFGGFLLAESLKILELRPLAAPFYLPPLDLMRGAGTAETPTKGTQLDEGDLEVRWGSVVWYG
jgi:hypothetical protein